MKQLFALGLALLLTLALLAGCAGGTPAASGTANPPASTEQPAPSTLAPVSTEATAPASTEAPETEAPTAEPTDENGAHATPEMSIEELTEKLGFGYRLPEEGTYEGKIVSVFDDSLSQEGGIGLRYTLADGSSVYAAKYRDTGLDAYDVWWTDYAERGSETVKGVEVRFRGDSDRSDDYRGVAYWAQNGFQYTLYCETSATADLMQILPLFIEEEG